MPATRPRPVMLVILDGWGWREDRADNAVLQARTPAFDRLWADGPHAFLRTSGSDVGLPDGQMGNSEVGHLNIGAGRVVMQDLPRIDAVQRCDQNQHDGSQAAAHHHASRAAAPTIFDVAALASSSPFHGVTSGTVRADSIAAIRSASIPATTRWPSTDRWSWSRKMDSGALPVARKWSTRRGSKSNVWIPCAAAYDASVRCGADSATGSDSCCG